MSESPIKLQTCREYTGMTEAQIKTLWDQHATHSFGSILSHQIQLAIHSKEKQLANCAPEKFMEIRGQLAGMNSVFQLLKKPNPENI